MSFGSLLPEILSSVGDFVAEPELKALTLTSCRIHDVFNRILYRSARYNDTTRIVKGAPQAGILRAAHAGNLEAVRKFISYGADVNPQHPQNGKTALHMAASADNIPMLETLLDSGADMELLDSNENTPLDLAVLYHNYEMIEVLVRYDPEPGAVNYSLIIWPAIPMPALRPLRKRILQLFLDGHPRATAFFDHSLVCAALDSDVDDMQSLLQWKMTQGPQEFTEIFALWAAVQSGSVAAVDALLAVGADPNIFSNPAICPPPIYTALKSRNVEMVRYLRERGAYLNYPSDEPKPVLAPAFGAAASRDLDMVDLFISLGGKVVEPTDNPVDNVLFNAISPFVRSPFLFERIVIPDPTPKPPFSVAMLQRLIELGADVKAQDADNVTALHYAVSEESEEGVKVLLGQGADVDAADDTETTPLCLTNQFRLTEILEVLLQHGADPNKPFGPFRHLSTVSTAEQASLLIKYGAWVDDKTFGTTPLSWAANRGLPDVMAVIIEAGASVTSTDTAGHFPLHTAILSEHREQVLAMVRLLLQHGAPINKKAPPPCDGEALCHAVTPLDKGIPDLEVVKLLLDHGANIHSYTPDGQNCIHDACLGPRFTSVLRLLIQYGGDLAMQTRDGRTPLHIATAKKCPEIVSILLEHNAPVNERMKCGKTALTIAIEKGYKDIATTLLAHGASPYVGKNNGTLPLHMAVSRGQEPVVSMLLDHQADVNATSRGGKTLLMIAAIIGKRPILSALLDGGAKVDATDRQGKTALDYATRHNKPEIVKMLRDAGASRD